MNQRKLKLDNKGFTLVEILAAIVILSITLIFILPIFPKLVNWSNESQDELTSSNLLSRVAEDIGNNESRYLTIEELSQTKPSCGSGYIAIPKGVFADIDKYNLNNKELNVNMDVCREENNLFRVKFEVVHEGRKSLSYTYIKPKEDEVSQ